MERVFRRPAHFWLNLQRMHDESKARVISEEKSANWSEWANKFPIAELKKLEFIDTNRYSSVESLLHFFEVSSPQSWEEVWSDVHIAYRQPKIFETSHEAIFSWVRATEIAAEGIKTRDFDRGKLISYIPELRKQTDQRAENFQHSVEEICADAGVAVVWVPELKKTGISGCARWLSSCKALIALTLRHKTDDHMWFTFFHEFAHITMHQKRHSFIIDNAKRFVTDRVVDSTIQREEDEANQFAEQSLIPSDDFAEFVRQDNLSSQSIVEFGERARNWSWNRRR